MKLKPSQTTRLNFNPKLQNAKIQCKIPSRKAHINPHLHSERRNRSQNSIKNVHYSINLDDIKIEIEELEHSSNM
jgi:hypothetical protein